MKNVATRYLAIYRSLLRTQTYLLLLVYLAVGFVAGLLISGASPSSINVIQSIWQMVTCSIVVGLWYIHGTALNDYADYEIDLINLKGDKDRPLVVGLATKRQLLYVSLVSALAAIVLSCLLSWAHVIIIVILLFLNISYSIKPLQISRRGGLAPLLLPLGYIGLPFFFGYELSVTDWYKFSFVLLAAFYVQFIGRIILKDYRDVKGDKAHGKITFLLRYGNQAVCAVSAGSVIVSSGLLLTYARNFIGAFSYAIVCLAGFGLMILYKLSKSATWFEQKPLLGAFGRAMTGVTVAFIAAMVAVIWQLSAGAAAFIAIVLTAVYIWSAQEAYSFTHSAMLDKPV